MAQREFAKFNSRAKKKKKKLKPVAIAGIEFDALIDQQKTLSATIPVYPVEEGFPVSDTIILDPLTLQMTLYVTNTPVTWLKRHGASRGRVNEVSNKIEDMWITSITIKKSAELGYSREVSVTAQKVRKTKKKTVKVPKYKLKSGETKTKTGKSQTSATSKRSGSPASTASSSASSSSTVSGGSSSSSSSSSASGNSSSKKSQSILYGVAKGLKFL